MVRSDLELSQVMCELYEQEEVSEQSLLSVCSATMTSSYACIPELSLGACVSLHVQAPARSRRTHALIPAMVVGGPEERLVFHSINGLIQDPMAVYRAAKLTNVWSDEEKKIFREKYDLYKIHIFKIYLFLPLEPGMPCT